CAKDTELGDYRCEALIWRYKWSEQDQDCLKAVYGGCRATKNNFETKEECLKVAGPICKHWQNM
ncbi:Pancreatic trypsin inhibitor, partial [Gonioctena quinquepunctata]